MFLEEEINFISLQMAEMGRKAPEGKRKLSQSKLTDGQPPAKKSKPDANSEPKKRGRPRKTDSPKKNVNNPLFNIIQDLFYFFSIINFQVILGPDGQPIKRPRGRPRKDGSVSPSKMPKKKPIVIKDSTTDDSEDEMALSKLKTIVVSSESEDDMSLSKLKEKVKKTPQKNQRKKKEVCVLCRQYSLFS